MNHRTIKGRIDYITDGVGIMGREWFTCTVHSDGSRTLRALTEMDDDNLMRDVTYSVNAEWKPLDCFIRLTINDRFQGSGWFRFTENTVECESVSIDAGRVSQTWKVNGRLPLFVCHAVSADAWTNAVFDMERKKELQRVWPRLASSPLGNGGSGPMIGNATTVTPTPATLDLKYLGEEEISVPAGTFVCDRIALNPGQIPRFEIWTHGSDYIPIQLRYDRLKQYYRLSELETSSAK